MIVAYDNERTIGREGQLPWAGRLPADMAHFRRLTDGKSVIMGRKTWDSLPESSRPLKNRENIVVSLSQTAFTGALAADSLESAFDMASSETVVIGGANIYEQALPYVDRIYSTEIDTVTQGGDAFFPELSSEEWVISERQSCLVDSRNRFAYSFVTYIRRNPIN